MRCWRGWGEKGAAGTVQVWASESELESALLNLLVRWPSVHAPFILPSIPPPSTDHHLPASHHQCSQGDERHREEGPQGINFSHGWESSSQKTWQPQTAWLKKKRREEERRRGAQEELKREGILHMMALREGFWILGVFFSPPSKGPMSWMRMSKLFLLFSLQSPCCLA